MSVGLRMAHRDALKRRQDLEYAATLRVVAQMLNGLADALEDDDDILGTLCSRGLVENLPMLPKHIRDVLAEYVTDEAAHSYHADRLYLKAVRVPPAVAPRQSLEGA